MTRAIAALAMLFVVVGLARAEELTGNELIRRMLLSNPWGLGGAEIAARILLTDKNGSKSELMFNAKSVQYEPPLARGIIRFSAPADLKGAAFLQVQKKSGDDERFLFLPELKRSRRISGSLRSNAFMGTDFSFADLDQRDLRDSDAKIKGKENISKWPCYVVDVVPRTADSAYSRAEVWIREDNYLPLRMKLYDRGKVLVKTFEALETKRVSGTWFISRSRMSDHQQKHTTELVLEQISVVALNGLPESEFSVRALEKL